MARHRKKGSKPTGGKRNHKQKVAENHQKWREEAQLIDLIPTEPEGALRDERVDPATQGSQPLPGLIGQAVSRGWATPAERKPEIVDELVDMVKDPDLYPGFRLQAASVLQRADKDQWERDNPELAGKTKGGGAKVDVNVQTNFFQQLEQAMVAPPDPLEEAKKESQATQQTPADEPPPTVS